MIKQKIYIASPYTHGDKLQMVKLQKKQKYFENIGRGGVCINIQGEIQAYNAVIKDLENEIIIKKL